MFDDQASVRVSSQLYAELERNMDKLGSTSDSWYDHSPESVEARSEFIRTTAGMCYRYAALQSNAERYAMVAFADELAEQADTLRVLAMDLRMQQQTENAGDQHLFSSRDLTDESRTGSVNRTDWQVFLDVEPGFFVSSNLGVDADEMQERALHFATEAVGGNGLDRDAKHYIVESFLTRVEEEHSSRLNR